MAENERRPRPVAVQAVLLATATALAQATVAVLYIVTARQSDPTGYGELIAAIALGMSLIGFIDFGSNALWIRELASDRMDYDAFTRRALSKLGVTALVAIPVGGLLFVWSPVHVVTCTILLAGLFGQTAVVSLRANRMGERVALLLLLERGVAAAAFFALLLLSVPSSSALWISLAAGSLTLGVLAYILTPARGRGRIRAARWQNPWRGTRNYGVSALAASGQQLDVPMLNVIAGPAAAGIYGAVNRWTQPMGLLATAFSSASAPFIAKASTWREVLHTVTRAAWLLGLAVVVCASLVVLAPLAVEILLGSQYANSAAVLQWLAAGTIPAVLNQPLATALQARRHDGKVALVYLSSVVCQLALVAGLSSFIGALGAAIAFFILQVTMFVSLSVVLVWAVRTAKG